MSLFDGLGPATSDPMGRIGGAMPHLLAHLWTTYQSWIATELARRAEARPGTPLPTVEQAIARAPARSFVVFCERYLVEHRIAEIFQLDANCGIRLTNQVAVSIAPPTTAGDGAMEPSHEVAITPGLTRHDDGSVGI